MLLYFSLQEQDTLYLAQSLKLIGKATIAYDDTEDIESNENEISRSSASIKISKLSSKTSSVFSYSTKLTINNKDKDYDSWKISFKVPNGVTTVKVNNKSSVKVTINDNMVTLKKETGDSDSIWNKGQKSEIDITLNYKKDVDLKISNLKFNKRSITNITVDNATINKEK